MRTIIPNNDRVVVRRIGPDNRDGFEVADTAKEKSPEGEVVASAVKQFLPGDRVMFGKYNGMEFNLDGEQLVILRSDEIFGKLAHQLPQLPPVEAGGLPLAKPALVPGRGPSDDRSVGCPAGCYFCVVPESQGPSDDGPFDPGP
jgi:chaperonin GroES